MSLCSSCSTCPSTLPLAIIARKWGHLANKIRRRRRLSLYLLTTLVFGVSMFASVMLVTDFVRHSQQSSMHAETANAATAAAQKRCQNQDSLRLFAARLYAPLLPHLSELDADFLLTPATIDGGKKRKIANEKSEEVDECPELLVVIPSVQRTKKNYLRETLTNLVQNLRESERLSRALVRFIVVLSDDDDVADDDDAKQMIRLRSKNATTALAREQLTRQFAKEIADGLVEIVVPPREWYPLPSMNRARSTHGDSAQRMRWRTKQNLDYAWAMIYAAARYPSSRFYLQLEDDIVTVPGYLTEIRNFLYAVIHRSSAVPAADAGTRFFVCEFATLGFIGRLFYVSDLFRLIYPILLLREALPVDWIFSEVLRSNFCVPHETSAECFKNNLFNRVLFQRSPALFQHVGVHSSLTGKIQTFVEKTFITNATNS